MRYCFLLLGFLLCSVLAKAESLKADLLVVGATESGWAAAIQAARMGVEDILIVHDGKWFGGQFTEQALACVDENKGNGKKGWGVDWHPMKRSFHRSGLFKELMDEIEVRNLEKYGSKMPGKPYHGPSTFRPAEAEQVFRDLIKPYLESGQIRVIWNHYPVKALLDDSRSQLLGVEFSESEKEETSLRVQAGITIDASDWGEVIQVSGAEYEVGPDPKSRYGEPSASETVDPREMNPITWAMIVEELPDEKTVSITRPDHFDDRNYVRSTKLSREYLPDLPWDRKVRLGSIRHWPDAGKQNSSPRQLSVFSVRRIVDGYTSEDGRTSILLNYMNGQDYPLTRLPERVVLELEQLSAGASKKNIVEMSRQDREVIFRDAKQHSLGVLYHLQNFVHEKAPDKANSFRRFQLSREFGTDDHLPPKPYIRESLRLKAMYMMREQDGRNRDGETKEFAKDRFSRVMYPDGLFAWHFHYDFHRTGRTYLQGEGASGPWIDFETPGRHTRHLSDRCVFPARSLVPVRMNGLLGAQGNVGFSSIVSAAVRLHDQRIHIGQASGAMAAVCLKNEVNPREIIWRPELLESVREGLCGGTDGVPLLLFPWRDLKPGDPGFVAINRLSVGGHIKPESEHVDFFSSSNDALFPWSEISETPARARAAYMNGLWERIRSSGVSSRGERVEKDDFDGDTIPDVDDALLFSPNKPIVWSVEKPKLNPANDGLLDEGLSELKWKFNFARAARKRRSDFTLDSGSRYSSEGGYGWSEEISEYNRVRGVYPEPYRDSFLFTRKAAKWECAVPNGKYQVTVCVGDAGHTQNGQNVSVEGITFVDSETTLAGMFCESAQTVTVSDGRLTVNIGKPFSKTNTTLCWLVFDRADVP